MLKRVLLRKFRPSPAMAVALLALVGSFGGAGWAANGGNFVLGLFNSATKKPRSSPTTTAAPSTSAIRPPAVQLPHCS